MTWNDTVLFVVVVVGAVLWALWTVGNAALDALRRRRAAPERDR